MRHVIFTLFIIFSTPSFLWGQATDLIPCSYTDGLGGALFKTYRTELERTFLKDAGIYSLNPIFIAVIAPSFEPESVLVIHKNIDINKKAEYVVAVLKGKESIWYLVQEKIDALRQEGLIINKDTEIPSNFHVSTQLVKESQSLLTDLAITISKISNTLLSKAKNPEEPSEVFTILDGTTVNFYSISGSCAMSVGHIEGHPMKLLKITELLIDYVRSPSWKEDEIYKQLEQKSKQLLGKISG